MHSLQPLLLQNHCQLRTNSKYASSCFHKSAIKGIKIMKTTSRVLLKLRTQGAQTHWILKDVKSWWNRGKIWKHVKALVWSCFSLTKWISANKSPMWKPQRSLWTYHSWAGCVPDLPEKENKLFGQCKVCALYLVGSRKAQERKPRFYLLVLMRI